MAQRRYANDQANRILASGELAPSGNYTAYDPLTWARWKIGRAILPESWASAGERLDANIQAGIPNAILQLGQMPELASNLWTALDAESRREKGVSGGDTFSHAFAQASAGGAQGEQELNDYLQKKTQEIVATRPPAEQNDPEVWKAASAAVQGSDEFLRLRQSKTGALNQAAIEAQDWVNSKFGLPPQRQQTSLDELEQIAGGALIPTPTKITSLIEKAPGLARGAARVAEWMLPGSHGGTSAVLNTAIPEGISQGLRAAGGASSIGGGWSEFAGNATAPTDTSQPVTAQAPATTEAATAPVPFGIVTPAQAGEVPAWSAPFQYGEPRQQPLDLTPTASVATRNDPHQGGGGDTIAKWMVGGGAALALIAAAARGKVAPPVIKQLIEDVDSPSAAVRMQPTARDVDQVSGLTSYQKVKVGMTKDKAIKYVAARAQRDNPNAQEQVADLNRMVADASPLEVGNAHARTVNFGDMPLLGRSTIPLKPLYEEAMRELTPDELETLKAGAIHADRVGVFDFKLKSAQQQLAQAQLDLSAATRKQSIDAINKKIAALKTEVQNRTAVGAKLDDGTTIEQARAMAAEAQNNPKLFKYLHSLRRIVQDVDESLVKEGQVTQQYLDERRLSNPNFMPSGIDKYAHLSLLENVRQRFIDKLRGRAEPGEGTVYGRTMYGGRRGPTRAYNDERATPVSQMLNPFEAVDAYVYSMHRSVRHNRSAKSLVNMVLGTDDWGRTIRKAAEPLPVQAYENERIPLVTQNALKKNNVFLVNDNGMIHFYESSDPQVARALRHNPSSVMTVMDGLRRFLQMTYTSSALSPWFAWRAARNELGVMRTLHPSEYTVGYVQRALKNGVANLTGYDKAHVYLSDPTFNLRMLSSVGSQIRARQLKRWADFLSRQLTQNSTMVRALGEQRVRAVAEGMIRSYNDTMLAVMTRRGMIDNLSVMQQRASILKDIDAVWNTARSMDRATLGIPRTIADAVFTALGSYVDFADSIRNSPRVAFFSENLEGLLQKYKGNIPKDELRKLEKVTQHLSGDITRAVGNKGLATALSVSPYGVNSANSLLHIAESFAHNKTYIGSRIITNMILPKVLWTYALGMLIGPQFDQEFWDNIPTWQRQSNIPMLTPFYFLDALQHGWRKPTMNDVIFMNLEPEAIPIAETVMSGLQSVGLFGAHAKDTATGKDILSALMTMANVNIPILDMYNAITGQSEQAKYERDTLTSHSEPVRRIIDMVHAVMGGGIDTVANAVLAGSDTLYRGGTIPDAFYNAFGYGYQDIKQRMPETPLSPLFGGQRRHYTKTQVRERNQSKFNKILAVSNTLGQMRKNGPPGALQGPSITDPTALRIAHVMDSYANSGPMRALRKRRSDLYHQIDILDNNQGKISPSEYTRRTELLKQHITAVDRQEEEVFNRLDTLLRNFGGIDGGIAYVTQHAAR